MRKLMKLFIVVVILASSMSIHAQNPLKIGYIEFNTLLAAMPGVDSVKIKLQVYQKTLTEQMDAMRSEFENKYVDYQSQSAGMSDLIRQTKEKELTELKGRIDDFEQNANQDLMAKQQELIDPFIAKAKSAISDVAKENKYTFVLNAIEDVMLYKSDADDMMGLVKKKLGIQ
jgi:outer membrane protein